MKRPARITLDSCLANCTYVRDYCWRRQRDYVLKVLIHPSRNWIRKDPEQRQQCDSNQTCRRETSGFFRLSKRNLPYVYAWLTIAKIRLYVYLTYWRLIHVADRKEAWQIEISSRVPIINTHVISFNIRVEYCGIFNAENKQKDIKNIISTVNTYERIIYQKLLYYFSWYFERQLKLCLKK